MSVNEYQRPRTERWSADVQNFIKVSVQKADIYYGVLKSETDFDFLGPIRLILFRMRFG
jgi:hypothetical protein